MQKAVELLAARLHESYKFKGFKRNHEELKEDKLIGNL